MLMTCTCWSFLHLCITRIMALASAPPVSILFNRLSPARLSVVIFTLIFSIIDHSSKEDEVPMQREMIWAPGAIPFLEGSSGKWAAAIDATWVPWEHAHLTISSTFPSSWTLNEYVYDCLAGNVEKLRGSTLNSVRSVHESRSPVSDVSITILQKKQIVTPLIRKWCVGRSRKLTTTEFRHDT